MSLKVIGGSLSGRTLHSVRGVGTRPLLGQVRESLFNILGEEVIDAEVWDLFAGTGATGIEALSRGARRVVFVEKASKPLSVLRSNLDLFDAEIRARTHTVKTDAWDPPPLQPEGEEVEVPPDLIFLDPPYSMVSEDPAKSVFRVQKLIARLAEGGLLCFHFPVGTLEEDDFDPELDLDLRTWGRSSMAIIRSSGASGTEHRPRCHSTAGEDGEA